MLTVLSVAWLDRKLDTFGLMPKIEFKEETLNGRASIIGYADREYLTLRIPRGNKKYSHISLQTTDVKIAHDKALDVYAATINQPLRSRSGNLRRSASSLDSVSAIMSLMNVSGSESRPQGRYFVVPLAP